MIASILCYMPRLVNVWDPRNPQFSNQDHYVHLPRFQTRLTSLNAKVEECIETFYN